MDTVKNTLCVPMCRVNNDHVDAGCCERFHAFIRTRTGSNSRPHAKPLLLVLAGLRIIFGFLDVLDGDHAP